MIGALVSPTFYFCYGLSVREGQAGLTSPTIKSFFISFHFVSFCSVPFRCVALRCVPFRSIPFRSIPFHFISHMQFSIEKVKRLKKSFLSFGWKHQFWGALNTEFFGFNGSMSVTQRLCSVQTSEKILHQIRNNEHVC